MKRLFLALITISGTLLWGDEIPKCHVFIDQTGWVHSDVAALVKVRYDSTPLCETMLSGYACFSYFEDKEHCKRDDDSLIRLFIKDAKASGQLID